MSDVNLLIDKLERARNGANVHTVNKAIFYLKRYSSRDDKKLEQHIKNCEATLKSGVWSALAYSMRRWF